VVPVDLVAGPAALLTVDRAAGVTVAPGAAGELPADALILK
jgi:hypothetical protein